MSKRIRSTIVPALLLLGTVVCGCTDPMTGELITMMQMKPNGPEREPPMEQNIVRVNKFFHAHPWLVFDNDGTDQIDGIRFAVYLEGPGRSSGVFGSGTMVATMYRLDVDTKTGREIPTKVQDWEMPPDKLYPWRCKKQTLLGWGYGLRLHWNNKLDLEGRQIAMVVKYIREDGKVITSSRQVLKVPMHNAPIVAQR
jgi:hypothetical protein